MPDAFLSDILEDVPFENEASDLWQFQELKQFSETKSLFNFQQDALSSALKGLWFFYDKNRGDKNRLSYFYTENGIGGKLGVSIKNKGYRYLAEHEKDFPVDNSEVPFSCFINRMSFWMATGSGKTLVIIKLIALLGELIKNKRLPQNDIMFLAHRADLLEQFKRQVDEYNRYHHDLKINLKNLREYEHVKHHTVSSDKNRITVFYYRSDLMDDEQKKNQVNFRNYDNHGKWFVFLDEAHKGSKSGDSKRQILYSILARRGFLFNFSATFTDPLDLATCAFNFNLEKFIQAGYGKHIYLSEQSIEGFGTENDFAPQQKQKMILKSLILQTYINKHCEKIKEQGDNLYHKPLLMTLVHSVNESNPAKEPDLALFFSEIKKVALDQITPDLFNQAKQDLAEDLQQESIFDNARLNYDANYLEEISYKDVLKAVFHAETPGNIEVLKIPNNNKEVAFKLQTADKPFALIKIGNIAGWLNKTLEEYEITESFEHQSIFEQINQDDSQINILMGSRAFYEGWDSNRPNIILFINIGVHAAARKFVQQSIGRGVRIEPLKNKRKRLLELLNSQEIEPDVYERIKDHAPFPESLFIFGTKAEALRSVLTELKKERAEPDREIGQIMDINQEAGSRSLLIPSYKKLGKIPTESETVFRHPISERDIDLAIEFLDYIGEKTAILKFGFKPKELLAARKVLAKNKRKKYFKIIHDSLSEPELLLKRILNYLRIEGEDFHKIVSLDNQIVHFKHIKFSGKEEEYQKLKEKIEVIKNTPRKKAELKDIFKQGDQDAYDEQKKLFEKAGEYKRVNIKYIPNHYYHPLLVSQSEKMDYLNHIIKVKSEVEFIKKLEAEGALLDGNFDWWMFSKLDESLDSVYIPYYNKQSSKIAKFNPDFIFWLKKENDYHIVFIDPKGGAHTDYEYKADGYDLLFTKQNKEKRIFKEHGLKVRVSLFFFNEQADSFPLGYRKYWINGFRHFTDKITQSL